MRRITGLCAAVVSLAVLAPFARAEEYEPPEFSGDDVILEAAQLPEGWSAQAADQPASPLREAAKSQAGAAGIDVKDEGYFATHAVVVADASGAQVAIVIVDFETDPKGAPAALKADAEKNGWTYRELGSPGRVLLAAGPEAARNVIVPHQMSAAVEGILKLASRRFGAGSPRVARSLLASALAIEPKAGMALAMKARMRSRELTEEESKDKAAWQEVSALFEQAFAPGAPVPPRKQIAAEAYGEWGLALLQQKDPEANKKAKEVLAKAVALEKELKIEGEFQNRYNLACAMSLLGEKSDAVKQLEEVLEMFRKDRGEDGVRQFLAKQVEPDPDLEPIRSTPEYEEMIQRVVGNRPPRDV